MLAFNLIVTLICFWLMLRINSYFIQPSKWNAYRFRLFALRDKLALLVMQGKVEEHDKEFKTAMQMINSTVKVSRKFEVVAFLRFLCALSNDSELKNKIDEVARNTCHSDKEYQRIISEYFAIVHDMFHVHTRGFRLVAPPVIAALGFVKVFSKVTFSIKQKKEAMDHLHDWLVADQNLAKCKIYS